MILLDKYVKFLVTHGITERQFLALLLVYSKRQDLVNVYKNAFDIKNTILTAEDKEVLTKKGFIYTNEHQITVLTDDFLSIFVDKDLATDEIFEMYPVSMPHLGVEIPLKAMDRNIFANLYQSAIMGSYEEHLEVKKDIEYAIKNKLLNIGIEKFIKSKYWLGIRKARLENKAVINTKTSLDHEF